MGGDLHEVAEISFFELDRLFNKSANRLKRKLRQKRLDGDFDGDVRFGDGRKKHRKVSHGFGGFTGKINEVTRTVVVTNVPPSVDEKVLYKHFSKCGVIVDVRIVRNKHDVFSGTVIVEFESDEAVTRSCALPPPHNEILGIPTEVNRADDQIPKATGPPKIKLTRQQFTQQVLSGLKAPTPGLDGPTMRKLHIKNLRPVVTEEDMRGIFKPFGEFEEFEMGEEQCWITFKSQSDAQDAMSSMQGFQLVGQELQISVQSAAPAQAPAPAAPPPLPEALDLKNDMDFGGGSGGSSAIHTRIELMKKLMGAHQQAGVPTVAGQAAPPGSAPQAAIAAAGDPSTPPTPTPGGPTARTLLLQNMFSPSTVDLAKEPRFYEEIREDTHDECAKFGKVLHVTVDPRGSTGLIYIMYESPAFRSAAENALNGRWFEGKKIVAMGIDDNIWQALAAQASSAPAAS
jgi:RNA recognition motif-containing protein